MVAGLDRPVRSGPEATRKHRVRRARGRARRGRLRPPSGMTGRARLPFGRAAAMARALVNAN